MNKAWFYGCSFTDRLAAQMETKPIYDSFRKEGYEIVNRGRMSASNYYIYDRINEDIDLIGENDIVIVQWSALTREHRLKPSSKSLLDGLIEGFIDVVMEAQDRFKENNINFLQYIGWTQFMDSELSDSHRSMISKFKNFTWIETPELKDIIRSNCTMNIGNRGLIVDEGEYLWPANNWGGLSEWVRNNIRVEDRYYDPPLDPHPSFYAFNKFIIEVILPKLKKNMI